MITRNHNQNGRRYCSLFKKWKILCRKIKDERVFRARYTKNK